MQYNHIDKYPGDIDINYIITRIYTLQNDITKEHDGDRLHAMRSELQYLLFKQELLNGEMKRDE